MDELKDMLARLFGILFCSAIFMAIGYGLGRKGAERPIVESEDTCTIAKTVVDSGAVMVHSELDGYELVPVCMIDSLKALASRPTRIVQEVECEIPIIVTRDSIVYIQVPMEEREFTGSKDSVDYKITTSGYNTEIRQVSFTYPERTITKVKVYDNTKRFGFGVCGGASVLVTPSGQVKAGPGVTAGVYLRF